MAGEIVVGYDGAEGAEAALREAVASAEEYDARMIVVGHHGEGPLKGALLGRTPYKMLHLSSKPVLVVRA